MNTEQVYSHVKSSISQHITELQEAVLMHEVEKYRAEIAGHLRHDVQDWINAVCDVYETNLQELHTKSRKHELVLPRQIIMWGLITGVVPTRLSLSAIGGLFERDHATALHSKKKVYQLLDTEQELRETVMLLINKFGWKGGYNPQTRSFYMQHPEYPLRSAA